MGAAALVIRPATDSDIEAVRALLRETWHQVYDAIIGRDAVDEVCARWHAPALLAGQLDTPRSSFLVACDNHLLAAHGFAYMSDATTLVVSRLYVRPSHQRQGIGRRILATLGARHAAATTLRLFAAADNARGVAFWRHEGFTTIGEGMEEGARVLYMEKRSG